MAHVRSCFPISSDYEFYVYLKASLPADYDILSLPAKDYYTEWSFRYQILRRGEVVQTVEGDYREIEPGSLIKRAEMTLSEAWKTESNQ